MKKGFSFLEIILYVGIFAVFATGAIYFGLDVISVREKNTRKHSVDLSAQIALSRIAYEIRRADAFTITSPSDISLTVGSVVNQIYLSSNRIYLKQGAATAVALTSDQVAVTSLTFTNRSAVSNDSKDIELDITVVNGDVSSNVSTSVELKTQFNQARRLLVDYSGANLTNSNTRLGGFTVQNTGASGDLIIDQIRASWSGGGNMTAVQLGGGTVEWTGSASSGAVTDITNFTLAIAAGPVTGSYVDFSVDMSGKTLYFDFIMSDASSAKSKLVF